MPVKVLYENDTFDEIEPSLLDELIGSKKIKKFFRSQGWVTVASDPVRGKGGTYGGHERRFVPAPVRSVRIMLVEDDPLDADLISEMLQSAEIDIQIHIERAAKLSSAIDRLQEEDFSIILTDLMLPDSKGMESFVRIHEVAHNIPTIILTGFDDKETALAAVHRGAQDYLIKGQLDQTLLIRAILYSIERQQLLVELEKRMNEIKTLRGMIPICSGCKQIRDDKGYWKQVEVYIAEHTDALFSHGLCPECAAKTLAELELWKSEH